jgi:hypothetical protein
MVQITEKRLVCRICHQWLGVYTKEKQMIYQCDNANCPRCGYPVLKLEIYEEKNIH